MGQPAPRRSARAAGGGDRPPRRRLAGRAQGRDRDRGVFGTETVFEEGEGGGEDGLSAGEGDL